MPEDLLQRPGETFDQWWYRVNEMPPPTESEGGAA